MAGEPNENLQTGDLVTVKCLDGVEFTGTVAGIRGVEVIVRFDQPEIDSRRNTNFDPDGCLTVHQSFVRKRHPEFQG